MIPKDYPVLITTSESNKLPNNMINIIFNYIFGLPFQGLLLILFTIKVYARINIFKVTQPINIKNTSAVSGGVNECQSQEHILWNT